jgi:hypothetical protein
MNKIQLVAATYTVIIPSTGMIGRKGSGLGDHEALPRTHQNSDPILQPTRQMKKQLAYEVGVSPLASRWVETRMHIPLDMFFIYKSYRYL